MPNWHTTWRFVPDRFASSHIGPRAVPASCAAPPNSVGRSSFGSAEYASDYLGLATKIVDVIAANVTDTATQTQKIRTSRTWWRRLGNQSLPDRAATASAKKMSSTRWNRFEMSMTINDDA